MAVTLTDHAVTHVSTIPANAGTTVKLFVRERDGTPQGGTRKPVLMLHGRSTPVLAAADLQYKTYGWAEALAKAGYDVFMMDLQGAGRSPRPKMDDPRNANPAEQRLLTPKPTGFSPGSPNYAFQLNNSNSDRDELNTVVEYIRDLHKVDKVAFIGWSAAALTMGPYAVDNPGKVASLFLLAPVFPPKATSNPPSTLPQPGFPMFLGTRPGLETAWNAELHCVDQREAGMVERVWAAIMENDPVGRAWGPPEGLNRIRNFVRWGWNETTAAKGGVLGGTVPVLIVYGEHDKTVNTTPPSTNPEFNLSVPALYNAITGTKKLMVKMACASHSVVWEIQHKNLHNLSKHWLKHLTVDGKTTGVFEMDLNGAISPA